VTTLGGKAYKSISRWIVKHYLVSNNSAFLSSDRREKQAKNEKMKKMKNKQKMMEIFAQRLFATTSTSIGKDTGRVTRLGYCLLWAVFLISKVAQTICYFLTW
jgi:hypothetical protein